MSEVTRMLAAGVLAVACGACFLGTSPEERARAEQGDYDDGDEEHRPGQPCLVCHGESYHPGDDVFAIAGTVYRRADDEGDQGLEGATVWIRDAEGQELTAVTNRVGNFMIEVDSGVSAPEQRALGRLRVPRAPVFPLEVRIRRGSIEEKMRTLVWRDGACAGCHALDGAGADREPRVHVEVDAVDDPEPVPPADTAAALQAYVAVGCATLDCHGDPGRPLRLYSELGLRIAADVRGEALTPGELERNVSAFIAVDPGARADEHIAYLKPLSGGIAHEGGTLWSSPAADGAVCVHGFLSGEPLATVGAACAAAAAALSR